MSETSYQDAYLKLREVVSGIPAEMDEEAIVLEHTARRMVGSPARCAEIANTLRHRATVLRKTLKELP